MALLTTPIILFRFSSDGAWAWIMLEIDSEARSVTGAGALNEE